MQFMILRRADPRSEAGRLAPAESARLFASLQPSAGAVRLAIVDGVASVTEGPFSEREVIAGFAIVEAASMDEALEWLKHWPASDQAVEFEIRESGCAGGCAKISTAEPADPQGQRFAILLRSSAELEAEHPVAQEKLDALDAHNAREARAGVLLAADGLRGSARGARVRIDQGGFTVVDGPFTEIKEMIAGFWLIRVADLDAAIAWAARNPYPSGAGAEVEIRALFDASDDIAGFTPDLEAQEQRIRAEQLEAGMRARFTA